MYEDILVHKMIKPKWKILLVVVVVVVVVYIYIYIYQKIGILNLQLEVPKSSSLPQLTPSIFGILW